MSTLRTHITLTKLYAIIKEASGVALASFRNSLYSHIMRRSWPQWFIIPFVGYSHHFGLSLSLFIPNSQFSIIHSPLSILLSK